MLEDARIGILVTTEKQLDVFRGPLGADDLSDTMRN